MIFLKLFGLDRETLSQHANFPEVTDQTYIFRVNKTVTRSTYLWFFAVIFLMGIISFCFFRFSESYSYHGIIGMIISSAGFVVLPLMYFFDCDRKVVASGLSSIEISLDKIVLKAKNQVIGEVNFSDIQTIKYDSRKSKSVNGTKHILIFLREGLNRESHRWPLQLKPLMESSIWLPFHYIDDFIHYARVLEKRTSGKFVSPFAFFLGFKEKDQS